MIDPTTAYMVDTTAQLVALRAEVERLRAALEAISNGEGAGGLAETERLQEIARAALAPGDSHGV